MNRKKSRSVLALLAVLLAVALLGGCGSGTNGVPPASGALSGGTTTVGINVCASCHTVQTAEWLTTKHANAVNGLASTGSPTLGGNYSAAACGRCHDPDGDSANIIAAGYIGSVARPIVGCEACHGGGSLHNGSGPISLLSNTTGTVFGDTVTVSGQLVMCTGCHQLLDPSSGAIAVAASVAHDPAGSVSPKDTRYIITDTHFATAGIWTVVTPSYINPPTDSIANNTIVISGYAMDYASPTVCTTCHNPHGTADINKDWAASLHADTTKGHAWALFNWSCDGTDPACGTSMLYSAGTESNNNRWLCQRCHTTTGFAAFAEALGSGNTALADRLILGTDSRMTYTTGWKPERLQCNGCHSDNRGTMRRIGAFLADYLYWPTNSSAAGTTFSATTVYYNAADPVGNPPKLDIYARTSFQFPDLGTSNICVPCHSGRTSGGTVHALNTDPTTTVDFGNLLFGDAHRFTSAATMFKAIGYEYANRVYTNPSSYEHDRIGTAAVPNTGTSGPCIGCHMFQPGQSASHLMTAVGKTGQVISSVSSEVCFNCHQNSSAGLAAIADNERLAYAAGKSALTYFLGPQLLTGVTTTFQVTTTDWRTPGDLDSTGNTTGKNNLGAFFNSRYLNFERGGYIHNSTYVKRLIYDSIDWLDDNKMNYSVGTSLNAVDGVANTWKALAMTYLLPNGVRSGAPSERP